MTTHEGVYLAGDYFVLCEVCGFKKRRSECRKRWDGAIVCQEDFETKHPLDAPPPPRPKRQRVLDARDATATHVAQAGSWVERAWVEPDWVM